MVYSTFMISANGWLVISFGWFTTCWDLNWDDFQSYLHQIDDFATKESTRWALSHATREG